MISAPSNDTLQFLRVELEAVIRAPLDLAFESLLEELGPENEIPGGQAMPMVLEAWPGGRWFRDLGNNAGHQWGHVQVIKPPTLLEISGPLFMSYPCSNHIQYRLTAEGLSTRLKFVHRAFGEIDPEHKTGVGEGWTSWLERVRSTAEGKTGTRNS